MMTTPRAAQGPRRSGISLVWILVVGLFLIMGVLGLTKLRGAIIATNEAMVIVSLRRIGRACYFYYLVTNGRFPPNLATLGPDGSNPPYLEAGLANDPLAKHGYFFTYFQGRNGKNFTLLANPQEHGVTGVRHFYLGDDYVLHATDENEDAYAHHPIVEHVL